MLRRRRFGVRPGVLGITLAALSSAGCSSLLGIDQDYVSQSSVSSTGGSSAAGGDFSGGFFGFDAGATGGVPAARGSGGTGGEPAREGGAGGRPAGDAGCDGACVRAACSLGNYEGTFEGDHSPSANLIQVPLGVAVPVSGAVSFELQRDQRGRIVIVGGFHEANSPPASLLTDFGATLEGTLDCDQETFDAKLLDGHFTAVFLPYHFEGISKGHYDPRAREVTGDWSENEIPSSSGSAGHGKWRAHHVGP